LNDRKWIPVKRIGKQNRERKVLFGLVEYYIRTGKPVGSNALKEAGFESLSSATIRNYFAHLEEEGYVTQSHSSGGRVPTDRAYRAYAQAVLDQPQTEGDDCLFQAFRQFDSREMALFLQEAAETLSLTSQCAVFLSAPRFDHDYVVDLKLVPLDVVRCLAVLVTDFGVVRTEIIHLPEKLSSFAIRRIEGYFHSRLRGVERPENLEHGEEAIGENIYNELMLRHIVSYSNFIDEDIYRTGFSRLLSYVEFQEPVALARALSLFEDSHGMRRRLKECKVLDRIKFWIGDDFGVQEVHPDCAIIAIPYRIHLQSVGAVGILGPSRLPYRSLFNALRLFAASISEALTRNVYKFKISFRDPAVEKVYLQKEEHRFIGQSRLMLLEDKRGEEE